jgi:hypothetical protein
MLNVHAFHLFFLSMGILLLDWGNMSIDIRIGDNLTDVYLKECNVIWEKQSLSWRMQPTNQHSSYFFCNRTTFSESRMAYSAWEWVASVSFTTSTRVAPVYRHLRLQFSRLVLCKLCTPFDFCAVARTKGKSLCHEVRFATIRLRWLLQASYLDYYFTSGVQFNVTVRRVFRWEGGHFDQLYCIFSRLISPHHMNRSTQKWILWSDDWKILKYADFEVQNCLLGCTAL